MKSELPRASGARDCAAQFADYITMSVNGVVIPGGEPAPARRCPCNCDHEASVAVAESAPSDLDADRGFSRRRF